MDPQVTPVSQFGLEVLANLFHYYGLRLQQVEDDATIPGSYWGDTEAGLVGNELFVRADTPVHSALHEACHFICMDAARRGALHTDAGGSDQEECAVCYLQVLMADQLRGYSRGQLFADMDAWGYHFRLGSTQAWFEQDAEDARTWLLQAALIDEAGNPAGGRSQRSLA